MEHSKVSKKRFLLPVFLLISSVAIAQLDRATDVIIAPEGLSLPIPSEDNETSSYFTLGKNHSLSNKTSIFAIPPKLRELGKTEDAPLDIRRDNNLMSHVEKDYTPKAFKDKEVRPEYRNDQYLGEITTLGSYVELYCRDHEFVDGDRVRIYINGKLISANVSLGGSFTPIFVRLNSGLNNIEFEALNMGTSGPNTAELKVYDERGQVVAQKEWNLVTGAKASLVVMKQ